MLRRVHAGGLLAALLWAAPVALNGQAAAPQNKDPQSTNAPSTAQPCSAGSQSAPCAKPAQNDKRQPAEKFPFPGETPASPQPSAPAPAAPPRTGSSADKKFPFPGESGVPAAPLPEGSSSSSSSSSNDGEPNPADAAGASDAGKPELEDKGSEGQQAVPGRHILHRVNPPGTKLQTPDQRAAEDVDVAHFYMDSGDFQGAYLRGLDAVKVQPDDPSAHFILAEAAMKLNKREEAIEQYRQCLKLDPIEKEAKAATKALNRLQAQR